MNRPHLLVAGLLASGLLAAACSTGASETTVSGQELYETCTPCHGAQGEGNLEFGAPKIAGLPAWYLTAQLVRYKDDVRGKHPDDAEGLRMRSMAQQLYSDAEIEAVVTHVANLPDVAVAPTLPPADLELGEADYSTCAGCHGEQGEGDQDVEAPPLAGLNDWYLAMQLRKYQTEVRGMTEGDDVGNAMQAMAGMVEPENIDNLAAYIQSALK